MKGRYFPYLDENQHFQFPPVDKSTPEGIVAAGGNLSPGMLLSAYTQGIFPWYSEYEPILWWSPDPRFVLFPEELHISKSMGRVLKKEEFTCSADTCFERVIRSCREIERPGQPGTWITNDMLEAYIELHRLGYAHSVEAWQGEDLAGGLYGVSLGKCFFGESMFSKKSNSSKAALIFLTGSLKERDFHFIDCQVYTSHLKSLGAREIPRREFIERLHQGLRYDTRKGNWADII
mgnify:FL=1